MSKLFAKHMDTIAHFIPCLCMLSILKYNAFITHTSPPHIFTHTTR